jgi:Uma2 family endonuclease
LDPDLQVICDEFGGDWGSEGYKGVPPLVIEILSPSTASNDFSWKKDIYESVGIREYWIIDVIEKREVIRYDLKAGKYIAKYFPCTQVSSQIFPGLFLDFSEIKL